MNIVTMSFVAALTMSLAALASVISTADPLLVMPAAILAGISIAGVVLSYRPRKVRLFIDFDGTMAEWRVGGRYLEDGYALSLKPHKELVSVVRELSLRGGVEIYVASAVVSERAARDKDAWLDTYIPEIDRLHRLYIPYGENKAAWIGAKLGRRLGTDDILLDDHSPNLLAWEEAGGRGIKFLNGINGKGLSWKGDRLESAGMLENYL